MDKVTADEIIACLPRGKSVYHYFKNRYALHLLSLAVGSEIRLSELKQGQLAPLLNKTIVKTAMARCGQGIIDSQHLNMIWEEPSFPFLLTISTWGGKDQGWCQISRHGYNLVLQLNFSNQHEKLYRKLFQPKDDVDFNYSCHPVMTPGDRDYFRRTFAWARIDLDFASGEALIEEVQSDWPKTAARYLFYIKRMEKFRDLRKCSVRTAHANLDSINRYLTEVLKPYLNIWAEAMLAAAIVFIRQELGIKKIFFHTFTSGMAVKRIRYSAPPKSLYTDLPRKFCFRKTDSAPEFLVSETPFRRVRRKLGRTQWHVLNV